MGSNDAIGNLIIRAAAGTGKTYQLTSRYIRLLLDGVPPQDILAVTFTRKAAGEIFDRVMKRLGEAASTSEGCRELSMAIYEDETVLTRQKARETLVNFVRNMHRARISTIDSFFGQMAGSFAPELGFPFDWRIADETVNIRNRQIAIRRSFDDDNRTDARKLVYDFYKGGTTRTLTRELDGILKDYAGLLHESEKDAWFSVPAPNLKERSPKEKDALAAEIREGVRQTCDAAAGKRKSDLAAAAEKMISLYTGAQPELVCGETIFVNTVFTGSCSYYNIPFSPGLIDAIRRMYDDVMLAFFRLLKKETEATYHLTAGIDANLETIKAETGEYGFDDITVRLSKLNDIKRERLVDYRLDNRTKHLLLDEFQDTSFFQWKVLRPLADAVIGGDAAENSFFCVGDTKQSIYQWRGGMPEIFDHVKREYCDQRRRASEKPLDTNYRSSPTIIETVNDVFGTIGACGPLAGVNTKTDYDRFKTDAVRKAAEKWNGAFFKHKFAVRNQNRPGFVSLEEIPKFDSRSSEEWQSVFGVPVDAKTLKLAYAARRIRDIHTAKPKASVGVLFRSGEKLEALAARLKLLGVEISQEGGSPLATAASVRAILALLRVADHPGDTAALARAATVPALLGAIPPGLRPCFERFATDREYAAETGGALSRWVRAQILTFGLGAFLHDLAGRLLPLCNTRESEKLRALITSAFRFEAEQGTETRLDRFISLTENKRVSLPGDSNVHLITIHGSKGLEYDVVVLPELDPNVIKGSSSSKVIEHRPEPTAAPDAIFRYRGKEFFPLLIREFPVAAETYFNKWRAETNESLNILYVAMTRARRELVMITDPQKTDKKGNTLPYSDQTFQDILRVQLESKGSADPLMTPGFGENIFFQTGDPDWYARDPEFGTEPAAAPPRDAAPTAAPCVRREAAITRSLAPSHKSFRRTWSPAANKERGLVIHACFEQIEWLDAPLTDGEFDRIKRAVRAELFAGKPVPKNFDAYLEGFRRLCGEPTVRKSLSRADYAARYPGLTPIVFRERPYLEALRGPGRKKGIIDRLVLLSDGEKVTAADIIDYKTDTEVHLPGADPDDYVRRAGYDHQLAEYRKSIRKLYNLTDESVVTRLFFFGCDTGEGTYTLPPYEVARA